MEQLLSSVEVVEQLLLVVEMAEEQLLQEGVEQLLWLEQVLVC
jgi:hypothetical protein